MAREVQKTNARGWRARVLGGYVLVVALLAAVWAFSIAGPISDVVQQRQREGLVLVARATGVALESSDLSADEVLTGIARDDNLRLTLIAEDGTVLAESTDDGAEMASHAGRPEVQAALAGEVGSDLRISETDGIEYFYVAVPGDYRGRSVAIRVSMSAEKVRSALASFRWTSLAILAAAVSLAGGVALVAFSRAKRPVDRLEQVRTDFVANASHELKTPVAGIRLLSESISQATAAGDLDAVGAFSERLEHEAQRLQSLVNDLMDLSRLEDERREASGGRSCDFAAVASTAYEAHVPTAEKRGLAFALESDLAPDEVCRVRLSPTDAMLVLDNLLDNALAYTEKGSVTLRLRREENLLVVEVVDTGIGIPLADQERVFERFYRVDTARSRELGGTGLGLSLVLHAVHRGDGTITLASTEGQGSTFTVRLPLA